MSWLRGGTNTPAAGPPSARPGQSATPAPSAGRSGYSSVPQYGSSNTSLPSYGGSQQQPAPALPSRGQRQPPQYNTPGAMPGQAEARGGRGGQFEVVPTPVDALVPRNVRRFSSKPSRTGQVSPCYVAGDSVTSSKR